MTVACSGKALGSVTWKVRVFWVGLPVAGSRGSRLVVGFVYPRGFSEVWLGSRRGGIDRALTGGAGDRRVIANGLRPRPGKGLPMPSTAPNPVTVGPVTIGRGRPL